jgi:arylsulfatase
VKPGTISGQLGHIIDIMPTCLEIVRGKPLTEINAAKTRPLEGRSLAPILRGEPRAQAEELCWEWAGNCAIRRGQWKLVWDSLNKESKWELYDLVADRTELHDLARTKPEVVKELSAAYKKWARSLGRKIPGEK